MENGLVGKWYLTTCYNKDLGQHTPQGGKIVEDLRLGCYRVEVLDLMVGAFESSKILSVQAMEGWRLFDSESEWLKVADKMLSRWQREFVVEQVFG